MAIAYLNIWPQYINALCAVSIFPRFSIFSVFALMAVILIVRPWGLLGRPLAR